MAGRHTDTDIALLGFFRESALRYRAEVEHLLASRADCLDPDWSVEPSSGARLYARVRDTRALFVKNFPQLAAGLPSMSYQPTGNCLPAGSLDRNDLRALMTDLDKFLQLLSKQVNPPIPS